jgi:hypothetical protein
MQIVERSIPDLNNLSFERQKCEALQLHKHSSLEYYEEELKFQIYGGKKLIHFEQNKYIVD